MRAEERTWPVTVVAAWYLMVCTAACVYYASQHFRPDGGTAPITVQLLCLGAAVCAGLYFFQARWGHRLLLALTALTIVDIGTSDPGATLFHTVVLLVLLLPLLTRGGKRRATPPAPPELPAL